jgi:hypothetical protein
MSLQVVFGPKTSEVLLMANALLPVFFNVPKRRASRAETLPAKNTQA